MLASLKNFETAFLGGDVTEEKPYNAIEQLRGRSATVDVIAALIRALLDPAQAPPTGAVAWTSLTELEGAVNGITSS